jgi:hypothetical protein
LEGIIEPLQNICDDEFLKQATTTNALAQMSSSLVLRQEAQLPWK